jgi:hypothetical protein
MTAEEIKTEIIDRGLASWDLADATIAKIKTGYKPTWEEAHAIGNVIRLLEQHNSADSQSQIEEMLKNVASASETKLFPAFRRRAVYLIVTDCKWPMPSRWHIYDYSC